jgi:hypothetical protein
MSWIMRVTFKFIHQITPAFRNFSPLIRESSGLPLGISKLMHSLSFENIVAKPTTKFQS